MITLEHGFSVLKHRWPAIGRALESSPLILIDKGRILQDGMDREQIDLEDVLAAARERQGINGLDDIEYAVLERSGGISIVLRQRARN